MIRLNCLFLAPDNVIRLYQGFDFRLSKLSHHSQVFILPTDDHEEADLLGQGLQQGSLSLGSSPGCTEHHT